MAKCESNNMGSLVLEQHNPTRTSTTSGSHFRSWSSFSASSLRRKILEAVSCGGSSQYYHDEFGSALNPTATEVSVIEKSALNEKQKEQETEKPELEEDVRKAAALSWKSESKLKSGNGNAKSEKLMDLLNLAEVDIKGETLKKAEALDELKRVVKELQVDDLEKAKTAASKVRLIAKEDSEVRKTLAMLGAIPPLVGMLDLEDVDSQIASLYALLNLGIGNDTNKAAIVKAGVIHKMLKIIETPTAPNSSVSEAIVANFLGLSALDSNKAIIGSSGAMPFLVKTLQKSIDSKCSLQATQDALRALYNLSIFPANISSMLETNLVPFLLNTIGNMEVSERILAILSNLVSTPEGRKAISIVPDAFPILVDVLNWTDSPGCQEKASYVLMVMAHKSHGDRQAMIEAGVASSLLELTLLGSALAQKRASRLLEYFRVDKGKQVSENYCTNLIGTVSAPNSGSASSSANPVVQVYESNEDEDMLSSEKKAVKHLVQQSLQNNMRRIVRRANLPQDFVPSDHLKSLTSSSTSKSLPF